MSSGWSALVLCLILGKRTGFGKRDFLPHSLVLTMVGTGMLWVGWYGFNAGSAVAADGIAANAFMTTTLAAAVAARLWPRSSGSRAASPRCSASARARWRGLVVITPAAGFVTPTGAVIIGVLAGVVPYLACTKLKAFFKYDDALDTFGVHGVGGTLGALVTGFFATPEANAEPEHQPRRHRRQDALAGAAQGDGAHRRAVRRGHGGDRLRGQGPHRPAPVVDAEEEGLDRTDHGEAGYHADEERRATAGIRPSGGAGVGEADCARSKRHTERVRRPHEEDRGNHQAVQARRGEGSRCATSASRA